jgi:hypothetical protein
MTSLFKEAVIELQENSNRIANDNNNNMTVNDMKNRLSSRN